MAQRSRSVARVRLLALGASIVFLAGACGGSSKKSSSSVTVPSSTTSTTAEATTTPAANAVETTTTPGSGQQQGTATTVKRATTVTTSKVSKLVAPASGSSKSGSTNANLTNVTAPPTTAPPSDLQVGGNLTYFKKSQSQKTVEKSAKELVKLGKQAKPIKDAFSRAKGEANPQAKWDEFIDALISGSEKLGAVAAKPDATFDETKKAAGVVNKACVDCHAVFRVDDTENTKF